MDAMALFALDGVANMLAGRRSVPVKTAGVSERPRR